MSDIILSEPLETLVERHVNSVLQMLRSDPEIADVVFDGKVEGDPERYVNVHHDTGFYTSHDASGTPTDVQVTFTIHSVGMIRWQAVWVSDRVTARLLGKAPQVLGRRCWRIEGAGTQPVAPDRDVSPERWLAVDRFTVTSTPRR